jgi:hypothetical protein
LNQVRRHIALGRRQPHRAHPHALGSERQRSGHLATRADPARGEHRDGRHGIDDVRREDHRRDLTGVAARLVAGGHDDVDAIPDLAFGLRDATDESCDEHVMVVRQLDDVRRGRPEGVRQKLDGVLEGDVDERSGTFVGPSEQPVDTLVLRKLRHAIAVEDLLDVLAMALGNEVIEDACELGVGGVGRQLACARIRRRHYDVHAVGLVADMVVDPVELDSELFRREGQRPQHAETPGVRHRRYDITAMREGKDRELDPKGCGETRLHWISVSVLAGGRATSSGLRAAASCTTRSPRATPRAHR